MTKILLVSGSRSWQADKQPIVQEYIERLVARAAELNMTIYTGDAIGVDTWVMEAANRHDVTHHLFWPRNINPRNQTDMSINHQKGYNYAERDREMLDYAMKEGEELVVMCLWNGESRGTFAMADRAYSLGNKNVWLWTPDKKLEKYHRK